MKYLFFSLGLFLTYACNSVNSQPSDDLKSDEEFYKVMKASKETTEESIKIQKEADSKTEETIQKATTTIVSLKQEVKALKEELHEANKIIDSLADERGVKFDLRPISRIEENR